MSYPIKKYPFDAQNYIDLKCNSCEVHISKKLAKALIVKFLKSQHTFKEFITECQLSNKKLKTVETILNNMVKGKPFLSDCLLDSDRSFTWVGAKVYHECDNDYFWSNLYDEFKVLVMESFDNKTVIVD